jgi:hypothetical protein
MENFNDLDGPDPEVVEELVLAMGEALLKAIQPNMTSEADVLSAMFTLLRRALIEAAETSDAETKKRNSKEIGRVLADMLLEFGAESLQ